MGGKGVSSVCKRMHSRGACLSAAPRSCCLQEQATSALGPLAHKVQGPEPSPQGRPMRPRGGVWWPIKGLSNF